MGRASSASCNQRGALWGKKKLNQGRLTHRTSVPVINGPIHGHHERIACDTII